MEAYMMTWLSRAAIIIPLCCVPLRANAQPSAPATQQAPPSVASPAGTAQPATSDKPLLKPAELDQLVASIALYPDPLLSNVLIASTYPLEVVQAERWLTQNQKLSQDQLTTAVSGQPWDDSLKALAATPAVLEMMSTQIEWTQKLGDAVLAQQPDVMDAVQRLRARAQANNKLTTTKEQKIVMRQEQSRQFIAIEPATPDTVYVPYYDPAVVYGSWPYPAYPPYYWGYPGYIGAAAIATGLAFGAAYGLARWGSYWRGGGFAWGSRGIMAGGGRVTHWSHNAAHRGGVAYSNAGVRQRFGAANARTGNAARQNIRNGAGSRAATGNRAGPRNRAGAGSRAGANRPNGQARSAARGGGAHRSSAGAGRAHGGFAGHAGGGRSMGGMGGRAHAGFGGGGRGGGRAGGRRSDVLLKRDITLLGHLDNGLGFYRFRYIDGDRVYVGVMAQEVETVIPSAVRRGRDGYLTVFYPMIGVKFQTYDRWIASGGRIPTAAGIRH
jgi:hypothetical protein